MDQTFLRELLIKHEGLSLLPYIDSTGHLTIGYGRNIQIRGISNEEALFMMDNDIEGCIDDLMNTYDFWDDLNDVRQVVLVNMCYNLGINKLKRFSRMKRALSARDYSRASFEMLNSLWARQVGKRAVELAQLMKEGEHDEASDVVT